VPDVGGSLTQWHVHSDLCLTDNPDQKVLAGFTFGGRSCPPGTTKAGNTPMLHVWMVPNECGPFAGIEVGGHSASQGCGHSHTPTGPIISLDDRVSPRDVGIIDFQDALIGPAAYDLVSLLQDARVNVNESLETRLLGHYVSRILERDAAFDAEEFRFAYAALGAQRNTKILGIFARLAMRDGKRQYLAHMPRIWGYLERNLKHEGLQGLAAWYDLNLPRSLRAQALRI